MNLSQEEDGDDSDDYQEQFEPQQLPKPAISSKKRIKLGDEQLESNVEKKTYRKKQP